MGISNTVKKISEIIVKPVTGGLTSGSWSQVLILKNSISVGENLSMWVVVLSITGEECAAIGSNLIQEVEAEYERLGVKTAESLYVLLNKVINNEETMISAAVMCLDRNKLTLMGYNQAHLWLKRQHKVLEILAVDKDSWQAVEGSFLVDDRWWISAGDTTLIGGDEKITLRLNDEGLIDELAREMITKSVKAAGAEVAFCTQSNQELPVGVSNNLTAKKRQFILLVAGCLVLGLLMVSVWWGAMNKKEQDLSNKFKNLTTQVDEGLKNSQTMKLTDQVKNRESLQSLKQLVEEKKNDFSGSKKYIGKWQQLENRVREAYQTVSGEVVLTDLPVWFALGVIKPEFGGNQLGLSDEAVVVLDTVSGTLISVGKESKKAEIIAGGEGIKGGKLLTMAGGGKALVLTNTEVIEVSLASKKNKLMLKMDEGGNNIIGFSSFGNNIYLLDSGVSEIWRVPMTSTSTLEKQKWLGVGVNLFLDGIVDFIVDGDVWMLYQNGDLNRWRRGAQVNFSWSGLEVEFSSQVASVTTTAESNWLIVLDRENSRIVGFDKSGNYQKQIKWGGFSYMTKIVFDNNDHAVYALGKGNIYKVDW